MSNLQESQWEEKKRIVRRVMVEKRNQLDPQQKAEWDEQIAQQLYALAEYQMAHTLMTYLHMSAEIATDAIIWHALAAGKVVAAPVVDRSQKQLIPYRLNSLQDVVIGAYNIREPLRSGGSIAAHAFDLILVPGLIFAKDGHRLGYGGGYYDRCLTTITAQTVVVGLAYDFQTCKNIPHFAHDQAVGIVVTPTRIIRTSSQ